MTARNPGCIALFIAVTSASPAAQQNRDDVVDALVRRLGQRDQKIVFRVSEALTELGVIARPRLLYHLPSSGEYAGQREVQIVRLLGRLGQFGEPVVPRLLRLLPTANDDLEPAIVIALGDLAPWTRKHVAKVRERMEEIVDRAVASDAVVRGIKRDQFQLQSVAQLDAARTHARTFVDPRAPIEALVADLSNGNPYIREYAAERLGARGMPRKEVVRALAKAVSQPHPREATCGNQKIEVDLDRRIRHTAARALTRLATDDPASLEAHLCVLELTDPEQRRRSALLIGRMGPAAGSAVPALLRLLETDVAAVQRELVTVLGMIGPAAAAAIPALESLAESEDRQLAARARSALRRIRDR